MLMVVRAWSAVSDGTKRRSSSTSSSTSTSSSSTAPRTPATGSGWSEVFISTAEAGMAEDVATSFEAGHSILLLHELASPAECALLREEAASAAGAERKKLERRRNAEEAQVRRWGTQLAADPNRGKVRMPVVQMLGRPGQALADGLLLRAVGRVAEEPLLGRMLSALFGRSLEPGTRAPTILHSHRLGFTGMEPAINVYREGGRFLPHTDKQALTVLITLSDATLFDGGGTAFWPMRTAAGEAAGKVAGALDATSPPALLVTPEAGTVLLFGGNVTHAGQPVLSGERCVLVASFSPSSPRN